MELVTRFPPSEVENLPVWRHILLRPLSQDVRLHVETDIIDLAQKVISDWESGGHRLGQVDKVVRAIPMSHAEWLLWSHTAQNMLWFVQNALLWALLAVVRSLSSPDEERVLSTVQLVTQLWLRMSPEQVRT